MSTVAQQSLEDALQDLGVRVDLSERSVQGDTMQTVRVCWHPWFTMSNLDGNGAKFNIPYPKLKRFSTILLPAFPAPKIRPRKAPFGFVGNLQHAHPQLPSEGGGGFGMAVTSSGVGSHVERIMQMPRESVSRLLTAWKKFGMVELSSLASEGAQQLKQKTLLYRGIFETPFRESDEMTLRAVDLVLEAWPLWLQTEAEGMLERAIKKGVPSGGELVRVPAELRSTGLKLIEEVAGGIERAHDAALNESSGILPRTKTLLEVAAKGGQGKFFPDLQDNWLLEQFPSFSMDTEVERAQRANAEALKATSKSSEEFHTALAATIENQTAMMKEMMEQRREQAQLMKLLLAERQPS